MAGNVTNRSGQEKQAPLLRLLSSDELTSMQKFIIWTGIVLTVCAVVAFIWLIVLSCKAHSVQGVVMASSFIVFAAGMLYFTLVRLTNPGKAWISLYITLPLSVAAFIISLYL